MGGIFGGIIGAINLMGGVVLWLFIGDVAFKKNYSGRWFRVILGGILGGYGLGLGSFLFYFADFKSKLLDSDQDKLIRYGVPFCVLPLSVVIFAMILEGVRKAIEGDPHE